MRRRTIPATLTLTLLAGLAVASAAAPDNEPRTTADANGARHRLCHPDKEHRHLGIQVVRQQDLVLALPEKRNVGCDSRQRW